MKNIVKKIGKIVASFVILVIIFTVILEWTLAREQDVYNNIAVSLVFSWILILVIYYIWSIYYYNFNYGLEDAQWERINKLREEDPEAAKKIEPPGNPFADQTLGLPPGTIRGTLALSLLVAGLAMIIASLNMKSTLTENEFFIDNFEFFKTAFLMMIAFYFGNKSLEFLKYRQKVVGPPSRNSSPKTPAGNPPQTPTGADSDSAKDLLQKTDDE